MSSNHDFAKIIKAVLAGERTASEELILSTQSQLYGFCFHLTKNRQTAEDLTHDTYIKAFSSLKSLKEAALLVAWLKKIARNLHLDYLKSAGNKNQVFVEDYEGLMTHDQNEISSNQIDTLKILNMMDEEDRTILVLIDIQECSYAEASQTLEIPEGTVKSRLSRARDKFSELYGSKKNGTNKASFSS